jgi:hypothetical protein
MDEGWSPDNQFVFEKILMAPAAVKALLDPADQLAFHI